MSDDFDPNENDRFCLSMIDENSRDLYEWLQKSDDIERTLGELDTSETIELSAEINLSKPVKVWVVDIEEASVDYRFENAGKLCIELPVDLELRTNLLDLGNEIAENLGFSPVSDKGQKYLFVSLD